MENKSGKKLRDTLKNDFKTKGHYKTLQNEINSIHDFYLDADKKLELKKMNSFKRFFVKLWWIFKEMILRLSPLRRIIFMFGLLFLLSSGISVTVGSNIKIDQTDRGFIGGVLITFVLILELKDKLLAREELQAGRRIQESLMPEISPPVDGWDLWLYTMPANEVCGDLIDFISLEENRNVVVIADVAGKGLNAALITAKLQASIRALIADYDLTNLTSKINKIFYRENLREIFASMVICELNPDSGNISFINAGHIPPCKIAKTGISDFSKGDTALGLMKDFNYHLNEIILENGEMFVVFSDGATDVRNSGGTFLEMEGIKNILKDCYGMNAKSAGEYILSKIDKFRGDISSMDDLSLVIIKKN